MTNSQLTMYYGTDSNRWQLLEERNFIVDDIEEYLSTKESITRNDFQFQKIQLDMQIKVDLSQEYILPLKETAIKYVRIIPSNEERNYYFYVRNCEWISSSAVRLTLHLDTLNTFKYGSYSEGYELSGETHISRQHKDRVKSFATREVKEASSLTIVDGLPSRYDSFITKYGTYSGTSASYSGTGNITLGDKSYRNSLIKITATGTINGIEYVTGFEIYHCNLTQIDLVSDDNISQIACWVYLEEAQSKKTWVFNGSSYGFCTAEADDNKSSDTTVHFTVSGVWLTKADFENYFSGKWFDSMSLKQSDYQAETIILNESVSGTIEGTEIIGNEFSCSSVSVEVSLESALSQSVCNEIKTHSDYYLFLEGGGINCIASSYNFIYYTISEEVIYRNIDYYSEELNLPVYNVSEEYVYENTNEGKMNWFLLITNQNDETTSTTNPVKMFLVPEDPVQYIEGGDGNIINYVAISEVGGTSSYYGFKFTGDGTINFNVFSETTSSGYISFSLSNYISSEDVAGTICQIEVRILSYISPASSPTGAGLLNIAYRISVRDSAGGTTTYSEEYLSNVTSISWQSLGISVSYNTTTSSAYPSSYSNNWEGDSQVIQLASFSSVDRTDTRIIKFIEMPYSPVTYSQETIQYVDGARVEEYNDAYFLEVSGCDLTHQVETSSENPLDDLMFYDVFNVSDRFSVTSEKSRELESKLYHSDFYYKKAVYDSFNFAFDLEKLNYVEEDLGGNFTFDFTMTTTANSTFMFEYDLDWKFAQEDYPNVMVVSRNNQITLYSNDYLTYLRTGYNYDVKNKNLQVAGDWISTIGSALNSGARSNTLDTSGMYMAGEMAGISAGTGFITGIANNILNQIQRENSINKTLTEKRYQTTSVYGSDDVDLMVKYSKNKLKLVTYSISEQMKQLVLALFHYTGYACNDYGVPDVTSRLRFNFVKAEIIFDSVLNFSQDVKNDIISKWATGVFFIHHYNNEWDLKLEYENYEKVLEDYLIKE